MHTDMNQPITSVNPIETEIINSENNQGQQSQVNKFFSRSVKICKTTINYLIQGFMALGGVGVIVGAVVPPIVSLILPQINLDASSICYNEAKATRDTPDNRIFEASVTLGYAAAAITTIPLGVYYLKKALDKTSTILKNIQQVPTFTQKVVKTIILTIPYIAPLVIATTFMIANTEERILYGDIPMPTPRRSVSYLESQPKPVFTSQELILMAQCDDEVIAVLMESSNKISVICTAISIVASVLSPLLYIVYNCIGSQEDSTPKKK